MTPTPLHNPLLNYHNNDHTMNVQELQQDLFTITFMTKECNHDITGDDFLKIADELALTSATLRRLEETMSPNPKIYTDTFHSDLDEITQELGFVLDEINECCDAIHKADTPNNVPWMFKKGRVTKLHKHLEALKTTLIVMRHVLWEGTDCEKDGNLLSGRAFLEAAIARNRDTISELYNMDELASFLDQTPSTMSKRAKVEDELPSACICGEILCKCLPARDIVSPSESKYPNRVNETHLNRRFSKRGVRLGVHSSILDHGAHKAPEFLKQKWSVQAHSKNQHNPIVKPALTGLSTNLSTIAESESMMQHPASPRDDNEDEQGEPRPKTASSWSSIFGSVAQTNSSGSWTDKRSPEQKSGNVGTKVKKAIKRMSHLNLGSHNKTDAGGSNARDAKGKANEYSGDVVSHKRKDYTGERKRDHILRTLYYGPPMCPSHWSDGEDTEDQQSGRS